MKDDRLYVIHIGECIERIERYTAGGKAEFLADTKTQDAVLRNLQTLGESARRVSAPLQESYPEIPWRQIAGFRNVLVHDYLGIHMERIWGIVQQWLPDLRTRIASILQELNGGS